MDGTMKKFIIKKTSLILLFLMVLLIIGLATAQLLEDNVLKETSKYKVREVTLDNKEALQFELKQKVSAKEIIEEAISIQNELKNEK